MKRTLLISAMAFLAACSGGTVSNTSPQATPAEQAAAETTPPKTPTPAPVDESPDVADFAGTGGNTDKPNPDIKGTAILREIRTARHGNYDRIVFEFAGAELPGYHIEYIDKPVRSCGSGDVVPLAGDAWLQVRFTPAAAHTDEGKPTLPSREIKPGLPIILEAKSACDFEADVEWVLGVSSPNKYRVIELKGPARLAVDIKHK
ncbi:MAG: hypothetical protein QUS14_00345 [Pyrinomonadaceae bacterium]|nr:hypothetical protein [Pyrinomonadaceae bacterium]